MPEEPNSGEERLLNSCPSCAEVLDVTDLEPFAKIDCPKCKESIRVRQQFNEFIITDQIGEGGMSRVFRAVDSLLNREVALKILNEEFSQDETRIHQFEKEARITASVNHPNVVKVYKVGRDQEFFYIAMELVGGGTLEAQIKSGEEIPEDRVLEIAAQVGQGLRAAKRAGLIHRDIKPGNILFTADGTGKIVDFGLSLIHGKEVDTSGEIWATPFYVPPEQLFDKPEDFRGDMYSLGASLFHVLAGKPPYDADTNSLEKLRKIKSKPVKLASAAPQVSPKTREVIDRTLALDPDDRYPDYDGFLEAVSDARSLLRNPALRLARRITSTRRRRFALVAGFAVLCALLSGILFLVARGNDPEDPDDPGTGGPVISGNGTSVDIGDRTASEVFLGAREAMFAGHLQSAADDFALLLKPDAGTLQPTKNWARFHAALLDLMLGDSRSARDQFRILRREGHFSEEESDAKLCSFFESVGKTFSAQKLPDPDALHQFSNHGTSALGHLAVGLAQWQVGDSAHAISCFETFNAATPDAGDNWLKEYQKLTKPYLADFAVVSKLPGDEATTTIDSAKALLVAIASVEGSLSTKGAMQRHLADRKDKAIALIERLENEARIAAQKQIEMARREEIDSFLALVRSVEPFRETGEFTTAEKILSSNSFESPEVQSALDDQVYLWQTAEEFLNQLVRDLNERGYVGPIQRNSGAPINGSVSAASRDEIRIKFGVGETRVLMEDVPPRGLIEIAETIAETIQESPDHYRRLELIVVYARVAKENDIAKANGDFLMRNNRAFRTRWTRILETDSDSFQ